MDYIMTKFDFNDGNGLVPAHQHINGGGWVADSASVSDTAYIGPNARVYGNAQVYGEARVCGNAQVGGNALVYDNALVFDNALVYDNARVCGNALVLFDAQVGGYAVVQGKICVKYGIVNNDISHNLIKKIEVECNLPVINGEIYCYKQVRNDLSSYHNKEFFYSVGKYVKAINPDMSDSSCASGLHVSNLTYWNSHEYNEGDKYLFCRVKLKDVIAVACGKIRCKKLFVIGICDNEIG